MAGLTTMRGDLEEQNAVFDQRQQLEVSVAQMETRVRTMIAELLQPTIAKTTNVLSELDQLKGTVSQHTRGLKEVQLAQFKALEQVSTIASFKDQMDQWDAERRGNESSLTEQLQSMQTQLDGYKYSLEQKESALHHLHRNVDRTAMELNRLHDALEEQRGGVDARIEEQSRKVNEAKCQADIRMAGLELKHNSLTDELWGEETGLAKVAGELRKTNHSFTKLEAAVEQVKVGKAEASQLERLRVEVSKMVHEANTSVTSMQQTVGNVVHDVREHFRTASQTISAHNASFVNEVRQRYQEELKSAADVRGEVQGFMGQVEESIRQFDRRVEESAAKVSAVAAEAREEVEELNKRRKRDKTSSDNELKALKKRLGGVFDNSDAVLRGIEHIYSVIQMMLESSFMGSSLEKQDAVDRKRIALMGVKHDDTMLQRSYKTEPQRPREECRTKSAPCGAKPCNANSNAGDGPASARTNPQEAPAVRVDNRCLSCSGQAPFVLSAFKMACLQYAPSPVEHDNQKHDRSELLRRRHELLNEARNALFGGPGAPGGEAAGGSSALGLAGGEGGGMGGGGDAPLSEYATFDARRMMPSSGSVRLPSVRSDSSPRPPQLRKTAR